MSDADLIKRLRGELPAEPYSAKSLLEKSADSLEAAQREIEELRWHVRVHEPSIERIKESHTHMSREAMASTFDPLEKELRHRMYCQGEEEGCYLCALVVKAERAEAQVAELTRQRDASDAVIAGDHFGIDFEHACSEALARHRAAQEKKP